MNSLTVEQIYPIVNSVVSQATGNSALTAYDASSFVSVAEVALKTAPDVLLNAISQTLSRTIMSVRPYTRKLKGLERSREQFGNHVRKLNIVDRDFEADQRFDLTDGESIDMFKVRKPEILQMNFYGQTVFSRTYTIFKDQLDIAFSSPEEFGSFVTMVVTNCNDLIEQAHENLARGVIANGIATDITLANSNQNIKLITEYNNLTGLSLDANSIYKPENYTAFVEFCYSIMATVAEKLTDRTQIYHNNVTGKPISRHTPKSFQKAWIHTPEKMRMEAMALSNVFNDKYLSGIDAEAVNFWQSVETPDSINLTCGYTDTSGNQATASVSQSGIFGFLADEECIGYTVVNQWSAPSPFNSEGGYTNTTFHFTDKYYFDNTENSVAFILE